MTLNGVIAFILRYFTEFDSFWRPITSTRLKIDLKCLQNIVFKNIVFHFCLKTDPPCSVMVSAIAELLLILVYDES